MLSTINSIVNSELSCISMNYTYKNGLASYRNMTNQSIIPEITTNNLTRRIISTRYNQVVLGMDVVMDGKC